MATLKILGRLSAACTLVSPIGAQATERMSVSSAGEQGSGYSSAAALSADARFVVFQSDSPNLVANDTNAASDIFLRDRQLGTTRRMSLATDGSQAADFCMNAVISGNGDFVGFATRAANFFPGDTNGDLDVFVRDRLAGTTELVSVALGGGLANDLSSAPCLSGDGRYVVFHSLASNLAPGDTNGVADVYLRDRLPGTTERVSVATDGAQGTAPSFWPSITPDGRYVVFISSSTNFAPGDTNLSQDVFVRDLQSGTTERITVDSAGQQANGGSTAPSISPDGRYVVFTGFATNLVAGDVNGVPDVFVRDRLLGTTELVSVNNAEGQGDRQSGPGHLSADGRYVAFQSEARNMVPGDTNGDDDVFLRDRLLGTTVRVSVDSGGAQSDRTAVPSAISQDGRWIVFHSFATNLVEGDTNGTSDVFVHDRDTTGFTSLCDPGAGGIVASCPCSNPPSGPTRGCENSAGTGGAALAASGVTSLGADTLVFTTSGQKPTGLSIVLQGQAFLADGAVFGQGVRCAGGVLKRLYSKIASGGSITAPDFGGGDLPVSAQSAAKGDTISPGQPRWYVVYYRDNAVLGGCSPTSNFNATQTGQVSWTP